MALNDAMVGLVVVLLVLNAALAVWAVLRRSDGSAQATAAQAHAEILQLLHASAERTDRLERELRREVSESARDGRQESAQNLATFQQTLTQQAAEATRTQNTQIDAFGLQLAGLQKSLSDTLSTQLTGLSESNARRIAELSETSARTLTEVRQTLDAQLAQLQSTNAAKLDEMRATVDEKLQTTLQARLGAGFKQVADQLEQVHKGLGEMQTLAQGVGDLKHLLTNVKTRGIFGEAQLASLLEQVFVSEQYAKFPNDDYERLLDAQGRAHAVDAAEAGKALELRIRLEAKSIAEKYVEPPYTTDFAILFLPTEGLYAEVLRRPGLMEALQREHRITLAGPTTLLAMLSSLQMGFRTLALEKRSSEVWQVLGAVKTEFGKFGDVLSKVKSQTQTVLNTLDGAEVRSRAMGRALKKVESLPESQVAALIPQDKDYDSDAGATLL